MDIARWLGGMLALLATLATASIGARAADAPVIDSIVDRDSGTVLWSKAQPTIPPVLKPGQAVLLKGRNFGPGPLTVARPGLGPPAGGVAPVGGANSVEASPPEAAGKELSKVLFGTVRAFERNLSSYDARIDIGTGLASVLARLQGRALDYFVEPWVPVPDTWVGDIYGWNDTEIDLTVPITAYEGPIRIIRIPVTGEPVRDIETGKPLLYPDPNTARVVIDKRRAFVDLWQIARTGGTPLASNAVPVTIALDGKDRLQYGSLAGTDPAAEAARQALAKAGTQRFVKTIPTLRSAADQYAYGEKAYWAWDWNLAVPHFVIGVDWNGIFGFDFEHKDSPAEALLKALEYMKAGIPRPALEATGYAFPELAADGTVKATSLHRALIDRSTGEGIRPFTSFGAVPLLPEAGAAGLVAPSVAFGVQNFEGPTPYPISPPYRLPPPLPKPLTGGHTRPTGWAGYVFAEAAGLTPGGRQTVDWIGFNCAACHAARVTFEYEASGKKVSRFFSGIPNPDWKATFLTLSGRALGLVGKEGLPLNFIRQDYPAGTRKQIESQWHKSGHRALLKIEAFLSQHGIALSRQKVDKTLLIDNLPPGTTEATLFNSADLPGDYANDYFFSPQAIPIITNHTPVRRALSRSELIDGFEGAYLHGEEPEGARGPMSARALQDLTLYVSTLHQDDETLRRIGVYRWLAYKGHANWLGNGVNEGTFVGFGYQPGDFLQPPTFPPKPAPADGLGAVRDIALSADGKPAAFTGAFARRFPDLVGHIASGARLFAQSCERCHVSGNAGLWTDEDMHPISAASGSEPVGRFFSPTTWQRRTQAIRTAILQNLFWMQRRGLLSDGHIVGNMPDNMDGLDLLVRPDRCRAPTAADGSVDLARASDLYKRLYTIRQGADHSFRIPSVGMRFEYETRFGDKTGVLQQIAAADPNRRVRQEEDRFVARHAYFTRMDDGYYYWDYQKMRRDYGILEYGLDPQDPQSRARIGGLPAAPHPWCLPDGSSQAEIDDLVIFLLTL
jgi:hypothetical protein